MRKIRRSIAKAYARELGMQHPNKRRVSTKQILIRGRMTPITVAAQSAFGEFFAKLMDGHKSTVKALARIEKQRSANQRQADKRAQERRKARWDKLDAKAAQFPIACGKGQP
jgi:hypothetical protein